MRNPVCHEMLEIHQVPVPQSIQIFNVEGLEEEMILYYFENTERSGGDRVKNINTDKKFVIITFENPSGTV